MNNDSIDAFLEMALGFYYPLLHCGKDAFLDGEIVHNDGVWHVSKDSLLSHLNFLSVKMHLPTDDLLWSVLRLAAKGSISFDAPIEKKPNKEKQAKPDKPHSVYVMRAKDNGNVKIGISNSPESRLKQINKSHPSEIELLHVFWLRSKRLARQMEKDAHEFFADKRLAGEWFDISVKPAVEFIKTICDQRGIYA